MNFHPRGREIKGLINGPILNFLVKGGYETCATQLSYALSEINNFAGIEKIDSNQVAGGKLRFLTDSSGWWRYLYSVIDFTEYLRHTYGPPEVYKGTRAMITSKLQGRQGVISFGFRHIDLWTGTSIHRPNDYYPEALWGSVSAVQRGIWFWDTYGPGSIELVR
jgi:hypothetical protein